MAQFNKEAAVDAEVVMDSLHRARTARMSYAAMITYAKFHAGGKKVSEAGQLACCVACFELRA
jgi:hypothetical protein